MPIRLTNKLKEAIGIINTLDSSKFELFLERVLTGIQSPKRQIFSPKELSQLENVLVLSPNSLQILIQAAGFLFEQFAQLKLSNVFEDLQALGVNPDQIEIIQTIWSEGGSEFLMHLKERAVSVPCLLESFDWRLQLPLGSNYDTSYLPEAELKIKLNTDTTKTINFTKEQLTEFFMSLELIQSQIDSLT
jgi:COMM domain